MSLKMITEKELMDAISTNNPVVMFRWVPNEDHANYAEDLYLALTIGDLKAKVLMTIDFDTSEYDEDNEEFDDVLAKAKNKAKTIDLNFCLVSPECRNSTDYKPLDLANLNRQENNAMAINIIATIESIVSLKEIINSGIPHGRIEVNLNER